MRFEKSQLSPESRKWFQMAGKTQEKKVVEWIEVKKARCLEKEPREAFISEFNDRRK